MPAFDARSRGGPVSAKLEPVQGAPGSAFTFVLNPEHINREYGAVYVTVPVARADWAPSTPAASPPPVSWTRNNPDRISIDFLLVDRRSYQTGAGPLDPYASEDIENDIRQLEDFRFKDSKTGQPPDLIFTFGPNVDRVRIETMRLEPRLWLPDGRRLQAHVSMTFFVVRARRGSY